MQIDVDQMDVKAIHAIEIIQAATEAHRILFAAPELNMANLDVDEAAELNQAVLDAYNMLHRALTV